MIESKVFKKIDLLGFQKGLNEQFLEIFEQKKSGQTTKLSESSDMLGLSCFYDKFSFFIPLKELKSISMNNKYESIVKGKSWVVGFNQEHGEVYSILSFNKIMKLLFTGKEDFDSENVTIDSRIVYLKNLELFNASILLDSLKLDYSAEFTKVIVSKENEENGQSVLEFADGIDFETFIIQKNMSENEWKLMQILNFRIKQNIPIKNGQFSADNFNLVADMVSDVYLDASGIKPVFVLNMKNIIKYMTTVSPF